MKCEYFLPSVVEELLEEKKAEVQVLRSSDRWYGVTYQEDKAAVVDAIRKMKEEGLYPKWLWGTAKEDLESGSAARHTTDGSSGSVLVAQSGQLHCACAKYNLGRAELRRKVQGAKSTTHREDPIRLEYK